MLATLLDQFPVTRGQLTPEAFSEWSKQANMQSKHAARLSTQQDICSCSSCCKPLSVSPWQRLALRSRVCARELLPDSLKAVGYLSIMSLCTSFILLHSTSCYFMLHPCISRSANSMWPLLEHCLNTAWTLLEHCLNTAWTLLASCSQGTSSCVTCLRTIAAIFSLSTPVQLRKDGKSAQCAWHKACTDSLTAACTASLNQSSKHPAYRIRYGYA